MLSVCPVYSWVKFKLWAVSSIFCSIIILLKSSKGANSKGSVDTKHFSSNLLLCVHWHHTMLRTWVCPKFRSSVTAGHIVSCHHNQPSPINHTILIISNYSSYFISLSNHAHICKAYLTLYPLTALKLLKILNLKCSSVKQLWPCNCGTIAMYIPNPSFMSWCKRLLAVMLTPFSSHVDYLNP